MIRQWSQFIDQSNRRHVLQNKMMRVTSEYQTWLGGRSDSMVSEISMINEVLGKLRQGEDLENYLKDYLQLRNNQLREINELRGISND